MSTSILCPECANCLEMGEFIRAARKGFFQDTITKHPKYKNYDPAKLELNAGAAPNIKFILDCTGVVDLMCCRMHVTTPEDFF